MWGNDVGHVAWLEALIWPEHHDRRARLRAAIELAESEPVELVRGDLVEDIEALVDQAPAGASVVVFHTAVLAYLDEDARQQFVELMNRLPVTWIVERGQGSGARRLWSGSTKRRNLSARLALRLRAFEERRADRVHTAAWTRAAVVELTASETRGRTSDSCAACRRRSTGRHLSTSSMQPVASASLMQAWAMPSTAVLTMARPARVNDRLRRCLPRSDSNSWAQSRALGACARAYGHAAASARRHRGSPRSWSICRHENRPVASARCRLSLATGMAQARGTQRDHEVDLRVAPVHRRSRRDQRDQFGSCPRPS
jgi:hypothetical protein